MCVIGKTVRRAHTEGLMAMALTIIINIEQSILYKKYHAAAKNKDTQSSFILNWIIHSKQGGNLTKL